jgi:predicted helicase
MTLTPGSAAIKAYYSRRAELDAQGATNELSAREAFKGLLETTAGAHGWTLIVEQRVETSPRRIVPDGTLRDSLTLPRGYWEAKDAADDLDAEIDKKLTLGYPRTNILFEDTRRGVLIQNGRRVYTADLSDPVQLATLLNLFYAYTAPNIEGFDAAVERFKGDTPELAKGLRALIAAAHVKNKRFQSAFAAFMEVCRTSLNPGISRETVDDMLIQHLLTERLMRTVFNNDAFTRRNVIAVEVERVIDALTGESFDRTAFIGNLAYFYQAIEEAARGLNDFAEKQTFINAVYEKFFQGYAVRVADTHGIVYTPQPIVDFMCAAVEEVLHDQFSQRLGDPDVCLIDPCTGTGNFIVNLLGRIARANPAALESTYRERLFANEVMLLPYYIASLNIEHAFYDLTGRYQPFEGLCFVDTLDLAQGAQTRMAFMTEANAERVARQQGAPITVIIGNPPYNVGQMNENDNNKNRRYEVIDARVRETYARDSRATLKTQLYDPYVKFFRWASDRLQGRDGIVAYVSNNSFVDAKAFDGMRKHLLQDFTTVYHLDLHGDVRKNPKLSGTTHNVFGIQVGVGITIAVRRGSGEGRLFYHRVPELARREDKLAYLADMVREEGRHNALNTVSFVALQPDARHTWRIPAHADLFTSFMPMGAKEAKKARAAQEYTLFRMYSGGLKTNRDSVMYDFDEHRLAERVRAFVMDYNLEVDRYRHSGKPKDVDSFVKTDRIKWSGDLKVALRRGEYATFGEGKIRRAVYRPFAPRYVFFDALLNNSIYLMPYFFPTPAVESENRMICCTNHSQIPFTVQMTDCISSLDVGGRPSQCFPFYTYDADGTNRRENITDWALAQFRAHYGDDQISKWDIFYYTYAVLHHADYRARFADALKRDLPRIPFAPDFHAFARAGRRLAALHVDYETVEPYPLEFVWAKGKPVSYAVVDRMRLGRDKTSVIVNPVLTLRGIPREAFAYTLGGRSAVEWVIDQYQVKTDARTGITSDANRASDDPRHIVDLLARVVRVSVETAAIVAALPAQVMSNGATE